MLRWSEKCNLIDRAPHIERPSPPKSNTSHKTREQIRAMIQGCEFPHLKLFAHLAYATAGRSSALLGLTWERCDFERNKIQLEDPTIEQAHKGRAIVPMPAALRNVLLDAQRGALTEFVIEWAGKRVASVKRGIAAAGKNAGIGKTTPHMLRHSAAVPSDRRTWHHLRDSRQCLPSGKWNRKPDALQPCFPSDGGLP